MAHSLFEDIVWSSQGLELCEDLFLPWYDASKNSGTTMGLVCLGLCLLLGPLPASRFRKLQPTRSKLLFHLAEKHLTISEIQEIMSGIATVTTVLVWSCQCLAFLRYYRWSVDSGSLEADTLTVARLSMHRTKLKGNTWGCFDRFQNYNASAPFSSTLAYFQPLPAILGFIGCFLTVFIFSTASWWNGLEGGANVAAAMVPVSR